MCVLTSHTRQGEASFQTDTHAQPRTHTHTHTKKKNTHTHTQAPAEGDAAFQHRHIDTQTHITTPGGGKHGERSAVARRWGRRPGEVRRGVSEGGGGSHGSEPAFL